MNCAGPECEHPSHDTPEPQAPLTIKNAYQAAMQSAFVRDTYANLRHRVVQAMSLKRRSKAYITEKQHLRAVDVEALVSQADALHLLQGEVRRLVEARGGTFAGVVQEVMQAISDRDLLERAEMAGLHMKPLYRPSPVQGLTDDGPVMVVSAWMTRPGHEDGSLLYRPHRTLRESIIHALTPIEPFAETGEPSVAQDAPGYVNQL